MKPLPTWEEVTKAVTVEGDAIRVVDLRVAFGVGLARRMTGGLHGGVVRASEVRALCDLDNNTETLGVAARRVGLGIHTLRYELRKLRILRTHDGRKGSAWNRIPKGVADKIAAMRGAK